MVYRLALLCLITCQLQLYAQTAGPRGEPVRAKNGMVVCVSPIAADVGVEILKQGGTAVDAAIAVGLAQAVTWPSAGNIGGGGFMLVDPGQGREPIIFEYRETAPVKATPDMFAEDANSLTLKASGVPGTVRGFALAHSKYGKLPWKDLVMPAVRLAEEGFTVNQALARSLNGIVADKRTTNAEFIRVYGKNGNKADKWQAGDTLKQPDLGKTLRAIAENGADAFYTGELAALLEAEMKRGDGLITADDLKKYQAKERQPVVGSYRGYEVLGVAPPSGGGIILLQMLNILEQFDLSAEPRESARTVHLMAEAMRRAYCDRARYLGDADFVEIPKHLTSKEHAKKLAADIDLTKATASEQLAPDIPLAEGGGETTHYSVIDKDGMAVSNTYTLENSYGNRIVVPGAGYILNNEMTDFNHRPGWTDRTGRVGTKPNLIAPGKRMLSSQCPTILRQDGKPVLIVGSPGGRTIPNTVLSVIVHFVDYKMDVQSAVDGPRCHHQWFPDRLQHEDFPGFPELEKQLKSMGHDVVKRRQGDAHSIAIDPKTGERIGAADKRIDGKAAGY